MSLQVSAWVKLDSSCPTKWEVIGDDVEMHFGSTSLGWLDVTATEGGITLLAKEAIKILCDLREQDDPMMVMFALRDVMELEKMHDQARLNGHL